MKRLAEEIKTGQLKQVYILCGEEAYLRSQNKNTLKEAMLDGGDPMNLHYFEGKNIKTGEVIDLAETMPFLAQRRVIILENSGLFSRGGEELAEYLSAPSETAYFIFVEPTVDKRSRLYKTAVTKGRVIDCAARGEAELKRWVLGFLKRENKKIKERDLDLFLDKTGPDMENIRGELEKLFCYCMDRDVITAQDIEAVCTRQVSNQIFSMIDAVANRQQKKALDLYYDLLALNVKPMNILALIIRQFNSLIQVKELKDKGCDAHVIGEKMGWKGDFVARKNMAQASKFSGEELRRVLTDCVETDEAVKTGRMKDVLGVELLIVKYSSAPQNG